MAHPSKPTQAELAAMRSALQQLKALRQRVGSDSALSSATLQRARDISAGVGPLIGGAGVTIASYYSVRADAVTASIEATKQGIAAIEKILQQTIDNYEHHEHATAGAAQRTATPAASRSGNSPHHSGGLGKG